MLYYDRKDEDLVMLTLAGEQRAYEELVVRYEKRVLSAARSIAPTGGLAEDAAQDAFVTAWMKLNMLREPEKFGAWVCRIAKNCARNMVIRFREYLTLDILEDTFSEGSDSDPQSILVSSEERMLLQDSVNALPERVRRIITMHYFEGLSVLEIAERMSISEGTVKWQLHDGRKRIRKELTAMNEQIDDTLVQRVMKKVEELKAWQVQNNKSGFEEVYKNVLAEVEQLPECTDKYHALADVLMRGWWWIPGESNDALFDRIREAAETGKNDEVMAFVVSKEDQKLWGDARIEFVLGKQIPRLEAGGFKKALANEYRWLGWEYCEKHDYEKGLSYFEKVLELLPPSDCSYASALAALKMEAKCRDDFADISTNAYRFRAVGNEIRVMDNTLRFYKDDWYGEGYLTSADTDADFIFRNASFCDGYFTVNGAKVGDKTVGSDGTLLIFVSDNLTVETSCGVFENCCLWVTERNDVVYNTYYKEGIGIVKQEKLCDDMVETRLLKEYKILGGKGIIPFAKGNKWVYTANFDTDVLYHECEYTVCSADTGIITLSGVTGIRRYKYDENSWLDMIQQIRTEYWVEENGTEKICDVSYPIFRAEILAKTPMEKAHTKAACAVARRIMDTDAAFNPDRTADGHWNFFSKNVISRVFGKAVMNSNYRWSFEWKRDPSEPVLNNDIYGILQDGADCLWNDDWVDGATVVHKHLLWGSYPVKTVAVCENAGEISVKAGTFENCFKVSLDIEGMKDGLAYRGGKKDYYFAPEVGIIKIVNHYCDGARQAVYELVSYEGTGDGYMPLSDGMVRRYEAIGLTDGDVAGANYYFVKDKRGNTVMFTDRTGIRKRLDNITDYSSIYSETLEEPLWDSGKHEECRMRHDLNNFLLLIHFFGRPGYYWSMPEKAVAWNKYRLTVMDNLSGDGQVPKAFWGHYASTCFRTGCALCGYGKEEEGYEYLEKAIEYFVRWDAIPDGEALDVGDPLIYGGVKVLKGKKSILLPDGTLEPLTRPHLFRDTIGLMNYGMTAPHGWEWFDGVRNQDRFKQILEKVLEITNKK